MYYVRVESKRLGATLYQVPTLGGVPKKVLEGANTAVTFSPDGRLLAFLRGNLVENEYQLIVANAGPRICHLDTDDP